MAKVLPQLNMAAASETIHKPHMKTSVPHTSPLSEESSSTAKTTTTLASSASSHGPISKDWKIPDRPKPGRKPKVSTNDEQRKEQNRNSQQKFRQNQTAKIKTLTQEMDDLRTMNEDLLQRLSASEDTCRSLLQQVRVMKRNGDHIENEEPPAKRVRSRKYDSKVGGPKTTHTMTPVDSLPSPNSETLEEHSNSYSEFEVDFTNYNKDIQIPVTDNCGFCVGTDFCVCREVISNKTTNLEFTTEIPMAIQLPSVQLAPGTCDMCQKDPEQARRCQELAATANYTPEPTILPGIDSFTSIAGSGATNLQRTSCSDFISRAKPVSGEKFRTVFSRLHAYPYTERPGQEVRAGSRPAMDLDAEEAAQALTSLASGS